MINDEVVPITANESKHDRGLHIVFINPNGGKVEVAQCFDTYRKCERFDEFITHSIPDGYIVIAAGKDEC